MDIIPDALTLENEKSGRRFFTLKLILELCFLVAILTTIGLFRYFCFIDNCVTGTLLGTTIGYFAADIRKIHA